MRIRRYFNPKTRADGSLVLLTKNGYQEFLPEIPAGSSIVNNQVLFECWGAPGGLGGSLVTPSTLKSESGRGANCGTTFTNDPAGQGALGVNYSNNVGYAAGYVTITPGDTYWVLVGVAGGPGLNWGHNTKTGYVTSASGGTGGFPDGGPGGAGAHTTQNLYNALTSKVKFKKSSVPNAASFGELWLDTANNVVKKCNTTYGSAASGKAAKWTTITATHDDSTGPSGGGGGGSTSILVADGSGGKTRILVAGGSGGTGGQYAKTGPTAWHLTACPTSPTPPFGADTTLTVPSTEDDHVYRSQIAHLTGGWGLGGLGGSPSATPVAAPALGGGWATTGGPGGPAAARHADGKTPTFIPGSGGGGGTNQAGGKAGGSGATGGAAKQGGTGASALNRNRKDTNGNAMDDWCAGGGGGGGGWFGGGGGAAGFRSSAGLTKAAGGGGGSNYASSAFTAGNFMLLGAARPPKAYGKYATGANGKGGFVRATYRLTPVVAWEGSVNAGPLGGSTLAASFTYTPADLVNPIGLDHYNFGTNTTTTASTPSSTTTVMVNRASNPAGATFTQSFTAPASGSSLALYIQVVDTDGDTSPWIKLIITGTSAGANTPATITAPAANATFSQSATATWTVGATPLVAFRLGITGTDLATGAVRGTRNPWSRGGSRVNLATDPGFTASAVWSSTANASLVGGDTSFPGVSGKNGKISWTLTDNYNAENHTTVWNNLIAGEEYRVHIEFASGTVNDSRPVTFQVYDSTSADPIASMSSDTSALAAGTYQALDIPFTPRSQSVYLAVVPSATGIGTEYINLDFEDALTDGFSTGVSDTTQFHSGATALKTTASSVLTASTWMKSRTVTATTVLGSNVLLLTSGAFVPSDEGAGVSGTGIPVGTTILTFTDSTHAVMSATATAAGTGVVATITPTSAGVAGSYYLDLWGFSPTASTSNLSVTVGGAGVATPVTYSPTTRNAWTEIRVPFVWDGVGALTVTVSSDATTGHWWDDVAIYAADNTAAEMGNTDSGQITYLRNMLLELRCIEDAVAYGTYFDGTNLNGNTGAVSWRGTVGASTSILTGTNILTGTVALASPALAGGTLYLDTLATGAGSGLEAGQTPVRASVAVNINPSTPSAAVVSLTVNSILGQMIFSINANDGAFSNKTVSFDIFRNGSRIVTGLTPDATTRIVSYFDDPAHASTSTYVVRAWDSLGGYTDTTTGTVSLVF